MDSKTNSPSIPKRVPKGNSVLDEINRGKEYSKLLEQRQFTVPINSTGAGKKNKTKFEEVEVKVETKSEPVKPDEIVASTKPDATGQIPVQSKPNTVIQDDKTTITQAEKVVTKPVELCQQLYPDVYVERVIIPEYQPNYDEIPRATRNTVNRDTLSLKQHMNLLAQPKVVRQRPVEPPYVLRRKVPGPSPRIIQLARPKRRQTLETANRFGATMEPFCIENCHRNVQDVTFVPVHDAVYFIELNKRRPLIEQEKLKLRMKRLQDKINEAKVAKTEDVLRTLYSSLKRYLLPPPPATKKPAECTECAKSTNLCANCTKLEAENDDDMDDQDDQPVEVDDEKQKLSLMLRSKMEKLLAKDEIEKGSNWDLLLVQISEKLAIWMKRLQNSEVIEDEPKAVENDSTEAKADDATKTANAAVVDAKVTN